MVETMRDGGHGWWRRLAPAGPPLLAAASVCLAVVLGWRGVDWPAQIYRLQLFRSHGMVSLDVSWYGGQYPLAYSVLFPPLAAVAGLGAIAAASAAVATWGFQRLVRDRAGLHGSLCAYVFAAGTMVPVAIGQLPYLLGLTFAILATLALRRRTGWAVVAAAACALTSSAAAIFLGVAMVAVAIARPQWRRRAIAVLASALAPVAAMTVIYRQGGQFPFPWTDLAALLVLCALALVLIPRSEHTLRVGAVIYAMAAAAVFVLPTPAGDVMTRLGTSVGVPILIAIAVSRRKALLAAGIVVPMLVWQWSPAFAAITTAGTDPSSHQSYYTSLLTELKELGTGPIRLEIPLTYEHWETAFVAPTVTLARGWERQIDIVDNPIFYRPDALAAASYRTWLDQNGISWVALPNAPLDYSAQAEAQLVRSGLPYLQPVWHDINWRLWRVAGSPGLLSGPAHLTALTANTFTLLASQVGAITVRVRYSDAWTIDGGGACLAPAPGGWTTVEADRTGPITAVADILPESRDKC